MYKDKDRQREAVREAVRRHRLRKKGITELLPSTKIYRLPVIPECNTIIEEQSHSPMMVGYVPPQD